MAQVYEPSERLLCQALGLATPWVYQIDSLRMMSALTRVVYQV